MRGYHSPEEHPVKDLILVYATNCKFEDYYRFVKSARRFCGREESDIAIFVDVQGPQFSALAIAEGITLIPVANVWKMTRQSKVLNLQLHAWIVWLKLLSQALPSKHRPFFRELHRLAVADWIHPQTGRWLAFRDYLAVNSEYRLVMTSDLRDVVFQGSPFHDLDDGSLHVFEQDCPYDYDSNLDSQWLEAVYGKSGVSRLRGLDSICSGTVIGTTAQLKRVFDLMLPEILRKRRIPLDQAIFNMVVAVHYDGPVVRHSFVDGPVLTLCGPAHPWQMVGDELRIDDRLVPVIHMYDRNPETQALFHRLYPVSGPKGD
jgi:hypothetical protein